MRRFLVVAGALVCLSVTAWAEDAGALGQVVTLRADRPDGDRLEITVTPPTDRAVEKRMLAWFAGIEPETGALVDEEPMDLSDFRVNVDRVASQGVSRASCSSTFSLKPKPVNLAPNKGWTFTSGTAIFMDASAYSTKGDVDVGIFTGPDDDLEPCDTSFRTGQSMDEAACHLTSCTNTSVNTRLGGIIANITTKQASYVGTYHMVFVNLP